MRKQELLMLILYTVICAMTATSALNRCYITLVSGVAKMSIYNTTIVP